MIVTLFYIVAVGSVLISTIYLFVVVRVARVWRKMPLYTAPQKSASTSVSIIVPARNEERTVKSCIDSLVKQRYPKELFELIIVDDDSSDKTTDLIVGMLQEHPEVNIKFIKANNDSSFRPGKKSAIKRGIDNSTAKLIITTDADCVMGNLWLGDIVAFYEQHLPKMIVAPVAIRDATTNIELLQRIELMSLVAFSASYCRRNQPIMCNGANLVYERSAFFAVEGFKDIDTIASGDDVLLMNKFAKKFPAEILFLKSKNTLVYTKAQGTLKQFINQHIRWSSKGFSNMSSTSIFVAAIVAGINAALVFSVAFSIFYGKFATIFVVVFAIKLVADFVLLKASSDFFNNKPRFLQLVTLQLFYSHCIVLVMCMSLVKKYEWKGRVVK